MKRCSKCGEEKEFAEFYKAPDTRDGLRGECKNCGRERCKQQHLRNIERNRERARNNARNTKAQRRLYRLANRERDNARARERRRTCSITRTKHRLQTRIKGILRIFNSKKLKLTTDFLGCSVPELIEKLGNPPSPDYDLDHICPCSQAQTAEEVEKLFHFSNLRWLEKTQNRYVKRDNWTLEGHALCWDLLGRDWID